MIKVIVTSNMKKIKAIEVVENTNNKITAEMITDNTINNSIKTIAIKTNHIIMKETLIPDNQIEIINSNIIKEMIEVAINITNHTTIIEEMTIKEDLIINNSSNMMILTSIEIKSLISIDQINNNNHNNKMIKMIIEE